MIDTYILRIFRGHPGKQYWEEFELPRKPSANVISALMEIQRNPINREGKRVEPVVWEAGCLEEVCGACSMLVNGKPRQACTALIETILAETQDQIITVAPLAKFPLIRDLMCDRTKMFENLKKVYAWVEADDARPDGFGQKISQEKQQAMYLFSTCFSCGCCLEACPQVNDRSEFIGPAAIGQVELFSIHPEGEAHKKDRLHVMMQKGGVSGCGKAQNCARVCPKKIPLVDAIAAVFRRVTLQAIKDLFGKSP